MLLRVLGAVEVDGGPGALSGRQRHLLAVLAARRGDTVSGEWLTEVLWDDPPERPNAALHNLVFRTRARLGPDASEVLVTRSAGYALCAPPAVVDAERFEAMLADARSEPDPADAIRRYDEALAWWRGSAFGELSTAEGLREEAVRLDELRSAAREERLAHVVACDPARAVADLEALVSATPYRERPVALLMEALHRAGRPRDALAAFARHRTTMVDELGLEPSAALRRLEHDLLTGDLSEPPAASPRPPPSGGNLTARRTSFVGRDDDLVAVADHVRHRRLVTLLGPGGSGKTSLAIETARQLRGDFPDGAWVVDLSVLRDGAQVVEHAAASLDVPSDRSRERWPALLEHVRSRRLLVVLDNCEHLVDDAAALAARLVDAGVGVHLLATSREPLRLDGELRCTVAPLALPPPGAPPAEVYRSAAARLFVDRALDADPDLRFDDAAAADVAGICEGLDGIPLALELAAARLSALDLATVADRLGARFELLGVGRRDGAAHHRTLQTAIDWSIDLLTAPERELLARLSVFVGGFQLDAVDAVCAGPAPGGDDLAATLAALVDKSLVVADRNGPVVRYRLLETIRERATDLAGDDDEELRRAHLRWAVELARAVGRGFLVQTHEWYRRLRDEIPNLRAAYRWAAERGDVEGALDLAGALGWAPFNTGHLYAEHRSWVEEALAASERAAVDPVVVARGRLSAGAVACLESRADDAERLLVLALADLDREGVDDAIWAHHWLGATAADAGDPRRALRHTAAGLEQAERWGSAPGIVYLANQHAEVAAAAGQLLEDPALLDIAERTYRRAVEVAERDDIEEGLVRARHGAAVLLARTAPVEALDLCEEALEEWRRLGSGNRLIIGLVASARVAERAGRHRRAAELALEGLGEMRRVGWLQALGRLLELVAVLHLVAGDHDGATAWAARARCRFLTPRWYVDLAVQEPPSDPSGPVVPPAGDAATLDEAERGVRALLPLLVDEG